MDPAAVAPAWEAVQQTQALATAATPREQTYIAAIAHLAERALRLVAHPAWR